MTLALIDSDVVMGGPVVEGMNGQPIGIGIGNDDGDHRIEHGVALRHQPGPRLLQDGARLDGAL